MHELVRTNNAVLITAIEALLKGADIPHVVLDRHMSVLEGSLGILPRRILVDAENWETARQLLEDAGLAHELRPDKAGPKPVPGSAASPGFTDDAVLGGRLRLRQKRRGHRVGHDAILLAAATQAHSGDRVVEFGSGVGAAGLALALRVPDAEVTLVEIDPELSGLAADNIARNGMSERVRAVEFRRDGRGGRVCRARNSAGHGRPRADEPAVSRSVAAERVSRSRKTAGACGARRHADVVGGCRVARAALRGCADLDLARRRSRRRAGGARAAVSAASRCCRFTAAPDSRPSAFWSARERAAARRLRCCRD